MIRFQKPRPPAVGRRGDAHHKAKLTERDVREIRSRHAEGGVTITALAREVGLARSTVSRIVNGKLWKHLEGKA